jgi:hypothetical protein
VASAGATADAKTIGAAPRAGTPVLARVAWDPAAPWQWHGGDHAEPAVLRGEELDRFEARLEGRTGERYTGHVLVGDRLAALPAGSQLDPETGWFTWAPGAGFVGTYDLVFVRWAGPRAVARHDVRVILAPKGAGKP